MDSVNASIFTRTSAGVFLPPTLTRCSDSQTYSPVAFLEPPNTKLCRPHAQFPYRSHPCLGLFLKNNVDVHPSFTCSNHGSPGSCLISHIHWFRTFKLLKLSALLSPYTFQSSDIIHCSGHLQGPVTAKPTTSVAGPHRMSPNEHSTCERSGFDTSSISLMWTMS